MFSTPQSKAFFSQQIIKGKLIAQEIQLVNYLYDRIWESKNTLAELIRLLLDPQQQTSLIQQKAKYVEMLIESSQETIAQSNQQFEFQVSLRTDIKHLEHAFFKHAMISYEEKIKDLKHSLLLLEKDVQQLEQKGLLPYIENPKKNNVFASKSKNFIQFNQKLSIMNSISSSIGAKKLPKIIVSLMDNILNKKQNLEGENNSKQINEKGKQIGQSQEADKCCKMRPGDKVAEQAQESEKKSNCGSLKSKRNENNGISQMLKILHSWGEMMNFSLKKSRRDLKSRIQSYSHGNRVLKQGIRNYKKIMKYEENESNVRFGVIEFTRQQAIDFLHEMNEDLQRRFARRNIYMVISLFPDNNYTKSSTNLMYMHDQKEQNQTGCLRQLDTNLNNSFLDQCSYLISDRFIADEEQNEEVIV